LEWKKEAWAKRRIEILDRLAPDVAAILPDHLFRVTVAHGISHLPTDEQVPTALCIASAKLNLSEAIRCVRLLEVRDAPERAALREKPREYLEASLGKEAEPVSGLEGLERVHELFDKALEDPTLDGPRKRKALLKALLLKSQKALLALEVTEDEPTKGFGGMPGECISVSSLFSNGGLDHDEARDRRTGEEAAGGRPEHPLDCLSLEARTKESQSDPQGEALFREEGVQKKDVSPGSFPKDSGSARQGELHGFPHSEKDPQGGLPGRLHHSPRTGADSPGPEPGEEALHALRNFTWTTCRGSKLPPIISVRPTKAGSLGSSPCRGELLTKVFLRGMIERSKQVHSVWKTVFTTRGQMSQRQTKMNRISIVRFAKMPQTRSGR
jgi:hypothetical protein